MPKRNMAKTHVYNSRNNLMPNMFQSLKLEMAICSRVSTEVIWLLIPKQKQTSCSFAICRNITSGPTAKFWLCTQFRFVSNSEIEDQQNRSRNLQTVRFFGTKRSLPVIIGSEAIVAPSVCVCVRDWNFLNTAAYGLLVSKVLTPGLTTQHSKYACDFEQFLCTTPPTISTTKRGRGSLEKTGKVRHSRT